MKKFFATSLAVIILLICATACSSILDKAPETSTTSSTSVETEDKSSNASLIYDEDLLKEYRAEVKLRVEADKSFDYYKNAYVDDFYILSMLVERNEPLLNNDELLYIYTNAQGLVLIKGTSDYFNSNYFGNIHFDYEDELILKKVIVLSSNEDRAVVLDSKASVAKLHKFGEVIDEISVTGEFCGYSRQIGSIFRDGEKVYLLSTTPDSENGLSFEQIATGVECVVEASYDASSDLWGLPLFLMKDGSLKFYQPAYENSAACLMDPIYEGGYH